MDVGLRIVARYSKILHCPERVQAVLTGKIIADAAESVGEAGNDGCPV